MRLMSKFRMKLDVDKVRIIDFETMNLDDLDVAVSQVKKKMRGGL